MKHLIIILFFALPLFGAEYDTPYITVDATATVKIPANLIYFQVTLQFENPDAQEAFEMHQAQEHQLVALIDSFAVPDSLIHYSLFHIQKKHDRRADKVYFQTRQYANVRLPDVKEYDRFQLALIRHGFTDFSAGFSSTYTAQAKKQVYQKAIAIAMADAERIATQLKRTLGKVLQVQTTTNDRAPFGAAFRVQRPSLESLTDIEQTLTVRQRVTVIFALK